MFYNRYSGHPVNNIHLSNIYFQSGGGGQKEDANRKIPEKEKDYPEGIMFGDLPAYGFYIRHVQNISFIGGDLNTKNPDLRPAFYLDDVVNGELANLNLESSGSSEASIWLNQSKNITVHGCILQGAPACFVRMDGTESRTVSLSGNILTGTKEAVITNKTLKKNPH